MKSNYVFSDLVCEASFTECNHSDKDVEYEYANNRGFDITRTNVKTDKGRKASGIAIGKYSTLSFKSITSLEPQEKSDLAIAIADEILSYLPAECDDLMIAGLGNKYMTSDSIGPKTVSKLFITRHISIYRKELFDKMNTKRISALAPGVLSQTGIESAEIFSGMAKNVIPDAVIVIDSLCARATERLASTVQISNVGITPGAGIGNKRAKITEEVLGCPVISVGIPTIVSSATLVYDALQKSGNTTESEELDALLENGKSFYVTLNEIDEITDILSDILADSICHVAES